MAKTSECIAVLDTETNWHDQVMSIGIVIATADTFENVGGVYYILEKEARMGGIFTNVIHFTDPKWETVTTRENALNEIKQFLTENNVTKIFAYCAGFDKGHLPELASYEWYDIMKLTAYKRFNPSITDSDDCYKTGRLKHRCGVEPMYQRLAHDQNYREVHNALCDANDELEIMRMMKQTVDVYTAHAGI